MGDPWVKSGLVPDVISDGPTDQAQVKYPDGSEVSLGNELRPSQVQKAPAIEWPHEADQLYTMIMSDPDAPSRENPKFGEWMHWLVVNIPGQDLAKGQELVDYMGSAPPSGTGLHRYAFMVFKQKSKISASAPSGRPKFKTKEFVAKHDLGKPVAGNFYLAQH